MIDAVDVKRRMISVSSNLSSGIVRSRIAVSRDLRKYFRRFDFSCSYDVEIVDNRSVLDIPALSIVLPLAWITGANVHVNELDRTFAESMDALQQEYRRIYPGAPFKTKLVADRLVKNNFSSNKAALLFSGGLDSTYSLFRNMDAKPMLIMIFGTVDIPISNVSFQRVLEREYSEFTEREGLVLNIVRTNALQILDMSRVDHLFWKFRGEALGGYWIGIGYSLGHIGQTVPLSIGRFSRLIVAGALDILKAHDERIRRAYPDASYPSTDEKIMWASTHVKHDASLLRHQKAFAIKEFLGVHLSKLRPCSQAGDLCSHAPRSPEALNCSQCSKCLRTIAELALAGIDPNECGFRMDHSTFPRMKALFKKELTSQDLALWWEPLQQAVPEEIEHDLCGSREFFKWLKAMDLNSSVRHQTSPLSKVYYSLPYPAACLLRIAWVTFRQHRNRFRRSPEAPSFFDDVAITNARTLRQTLSPLPPPFSKPCTD